MILSTTAPWWGLTALWLTSPAWTRQLDRRDSLKLHTRAVLSLGKDRAEEADLGEVVDGGSWLEKPLVDAPHHQAGSSQNPAPCLLASLQQLARYWACRRCLINVLDWPKK